MIAEDYVSFETAKLLKESGFDKYPIYPCYKEDDRKLFIDIPTTLDAINYRFIPAPTLQMAMKWLREVHKLYIVVRPYVTEEGFFSLFDVKSVKEKEIVTNLKTKTGFNTYEEACESAIKYCLEHLI